MRANIKTNIKRGLAVGLIAIMAAINPMQTLQPTGAGAGAPAVAKAAETDKAPYVGEVRLAVDKDADKAKQILESDGYEVIDQDLNEKAGSFWNDLGEQAVYMGIKRTDDESKAIRDMKTMNMLGNYSYSDLKTRIEESKSEAKDTYDKLNTAIKEYSKNYQSGDAAAKHAHDLMNLYREDDSDTLMGDVFLKDNSEKQIIKIFVEGNVYNVSAVGKSLVYGVEEETADGEIWLDRLSKVSSYNALVKKYALELYGNENVTGEEKSKVEKMIAADLDKTARVFLDNWGDIRKVFTDEEESIQETRDFFEDDSEEKDVIAFSGNLADATASIYSRTVKYGKKTLYDFFTVPAATFEKNIKNLYPLVYSLSKGQRALADTMDIADLFQAAFMRIAAKENKEEMETGQKKIDDMHKKVTEPISIYEGVDRDQFSENAAMTSAATAKMKAVEREETFTDKALRYAQYFTRFCAAGSLIVIGSIRWNLASIRGEIREQNKLINELRQYREASFNNGTGGDVIDLSDIYSAKNKKNNLIYQEACYEDSFNVVKWIALGAVIIFAIVEIVQYCRKKGKEFNHTQLPIPEVLVDYDVENEAGRNVTYHVVKWNRMREPKGDEKASDRADRGDLNGDAARQWLALYTTTDKAMGSPILADNIVVNVGDKAQPADIGDGVYEPLTRFGEKSIQNLVDSNYSYHDEVGGIWLWYQKGNATAENIIDDTEEAEEEVVAEADDTSQDEEAQATAEVVSGTAAEEDIADTTGSNIGRGSAVFIGLGGVTVGIIAGIFIGFFIRRKKQVVD